MGIERRFDVVIKDGLVFDGTGAPRVRGDVAIAAGRVVAMGRVDSREAAEVIDGTGMHVAPGFVDLHTHYDAQLFWDPYCTLSGWHGVTSVAIGNCGFGFAPVQPELREHAMRSMTRVEAIPYESMRLGLPWDWVTFGEFLDSLDATPKAVNVLPYVPAGPMLVDVLGLEDAKAGRMPTHEEHDRLAVMLDAAMQAGGCGWSAQRLPPSGPAAVQRDWDGTPMPTDVMHDETCRVFAARSGSTERGRAAADAHDRRRPARHRPPRGDRDVVGASGAAQRGAGVRESPARPPQGDRVARAVPRARDPGLRPRRDDRRRVHVHVRGLEPLRRLRRLDGGDDRQRERAAAQAGRPRTAPGAQGSPAERGHRGARDGHRAVTTVARHRALPRDVGAARSPTPPGKHPVDAMLDIAVADGLRTLFFAAPPQGASDLLKEIVQYPHMLLGVSDGGAHTKFLTAGRYPTETLAEQVRETPVDHLRGGPSAARPPFPPSSPGSTTAACCDPDGPADVVVYDPERLCVGPNEVVEDLPGGEWRRIQKASGYRAVFVNGVRTIEDDQQTERHPGRLLRHGRG